MSCSLDGSASSRSLRIKSIHRDKNNDNSYMCIKTDDNNNNNIFIGDDTVSSNVTSHYSYRSLLSLSPHCGCEVFLWFYSGHFAMR